MCSLSLFPAPVTAGLTLREHNNELVPGQPDTQWSDLPSPQFTRDTLKGHSRPESSSKSAFLDQRDTLWMRSAGACTGATEVTSVTISENNHESCGSSLQQSCD